MVMAHTHALHISYNQLNSELQQNSTPLKHIGGFDWPPEETQWKASNPDGLSLRLSSPI